MDQASRSASVERKNSYRDKDYDDSGRKGKPSYGSRDNRYEKSRSRSPRSQERRSASPQIQNKGNVLYVGNLSRRTNEDDLREKFEKYGAVKIHMIKDPFTHECRGFAFVEYDNDHSATEAVDNLDQIELDRRKIKVERSKRGIGYQKTPGEYLGQFKSNNRHRSRSPNQNQRRFSRGGRDRYTRDRTPSRERGSRDNYNRERHSRSRSKDRNGGYDSRRYRDNNYRERNRSRSKDRYRDNYRNKDRERSRSRSQGRR